MEDPEKQPLAEAQPRPATLDYRRPDASVKWVTIGKFSPFEGQLALAKLQAHDILAQLYDQNAANVYAGMLGLAKLQVMEQDVQRAKELLAKPAEVTDEDDYVDEAWRCPKCRRKDVKIDPLTPAQWLICIATFFLGFPFLKRTRHCESCGHQWRS